MSGLIPFIGPGAPPTVDTSGNPGAGSAGLSYDLDPSDLLYRALLRNIRDADADAGNLFVKRFLARPQYWVDTTRDRITGLKGYGAASTRAGLLQYLKSKVGFTQELHDITDRLSLDQLRKLISLAVALWKRKGTAAGMVEMIQLLTGKAPVYRDWFAFRNILGETELGQEDLGSDNWIIGGNAGSMDEYLSMLRIMDDGLLDTQLLLDLVGLLRPTNERIELAVVDFLDVFDAGRGLWTPSGTAAASVVNGLFVLQPGAVESPIIPGVAAASLVSYVTDHTFILGDAAAQHVLKFLITGAQAYRLTLTVAPAPGQITLDWMAPGVTTLAQLTSGSITLAPGTRYNVRVVINSVGTVNYIAVFIDGVKVVDISHSGGAQSGGLQLSAPVGNVASNQVDNFEVWRQPLRFALVAPNNSITKTSNF